MNQYKKHFLESSDHQDSDTSFIFEIFSTKCFATIWKLSIETLMEEIEWVFKESWKF